jgi:chromosome segregation ATPase
MAETTIAPAPPGVQSTFDKPLGPQPAKRDHADKYRKAFAELTAEDVKPKGQELAPNPTPPVTEETAPAATTKEPEKEPVVEGKKPESPLDAVLAKTPKDAQSVEEPDALKEFESVEKPTPDNWSKARGVMKNLSTELKTLREKVQTLEKTPKAEPSVVEALTKERDELLSKFQGQEEKLKAINYQYSDEFQGLLKEKETKVNKLSSRVKAYGGDASALVEALALPEGKVKTAEIKAALAEVDSDDRPRIYSLIEDLDSHEEKIADATKNSAPKWDELVAKREVQTVEQSQAQIKQLETQYGKIVEGIPANAVTFREVPDDVPGAKEWNEEIRTAMDRGLNVLKPNGADFPQSVEIAVKGSRYDSLEKRYLSLHSDYSDLKSKYNELAGAGPDFKGGKKTGPETPKKPAAKFHETLAAIKSGQMGDM